MAIIWLCVFTVVKLISCRRHHLNHGLSGIVMHLLILLPCRCKLVVRLEHEVVLWSKGVLLQLSRAVEVVNLVVSRVISAICKSLMIILLFIARLYDGTLFLRLISILLITHLHQLIAVEEVAWKVLIVRRLPKREALVAVMLLAVEDNLLFKSLITVVSGCSLGSLIFILAAILVVVLVAHHNTLVFNLRQSDLVLFILCDALHFLVLALIRLNLLRLLHVNTVITLLEPSFFSIFLLFIMQLLLLLLLDIDFILQHTADTASKIALVLLNLARRRLNCCVALRQAHLHALVHYISILVHLYFLF